MQQKIICSKCGAENAANTQFCLYCGSILQENCPNCGNAVSPGSKFCSVCGAGLGWGVKIKDLKQQMFQMESNLVSMVTQAGKDMKADLLSSNADIKATLASYSNELLSQHNMLNDTVTNINRLIREEHNLSQSRMLIKLGLAFNGLGLAAIGASFLMSNIPYLTFGGIGLVLLGFILQFISVFIGGK